MTARYGSQELSFLVSLTFFSSLMLLYYVAGDYIAFADEADGYTHLYEVMDQYHQTLDVYTDQDAGGNHYFPTGWMGDAGEVTFDGRCTTNPRFGQTCIKVTYSGGWAGNGWAGIHWQNPENNWGNVENGGYDLTGATELTFWARSDSEAIVDFFVGGIGRQLCDGVPVAPFPDSLPRTPLPPWCFGPQPRSLSNTWTKYTIDLSGWDLSHVIGGFGWAIDNDSNPSGATFYLDNIQFNLARPSEVRFFRSYEALSPAHDFDRVMNNVSYTYDGAVAMLALAARGTAEDWQRAKLLADAFVYAQQNDRYYTDGRLRNAYMCGDLIDHAVEETFGKAKLPGWWDEQAQEWIEDSVQVGSHTGNMAWVMLALLTYYQHQGGQNYLDTALLLGEWIVQETQDSQPPYGYTAGYEGWEESLEHPEGSTKLTGKSTEHNIDVYSTFMKAWTVTGDDIWRERAIHALLFLHSMWNDQDRHFWVGTLEDGITPWTHPDAQPIDVNTWGLMALDNAEKHGASITWVENNAAVDALGFSGFDFNTDTDGLWWEGLAQMVIAQQILGEETKAEFYLNQLRSVQISGENNNGKGIVAATPDGISTGLYVGEYEWLYYSRLHVAATAWYLMAERGFNPLEVLCPADISLVATADTDYNWIIVCGDIETAEELCQEIQNCLTVSYFDPQTQGFVTHPCGTPINNFELHVGHPYQVTISAPGTWEPGGAIPTAVTFDLVTTPDTDYNWVGVPVEFSSLTNAEELGQNIPNCLTVSYFDPQTQGMVTHPVGAPVNNFGLQLGQAYQITVSQDTQWPTW